MEDKNLTSTRRTVGPYGKFAFLFFVKTDTKKSTQLKSCVLKLNIYWFCTQIRSKQLYKWNKVIDLNIYQRNNTLNYSRIKKKITLQIKQTCKLS